MYFNFPSCAITPRDCGAFPTKGFVSWPRKEATPLIPLRFTGQVLYIKVPCICTTPQTTVYPRIYDCGDITSCCQTTRIYQSLLPTDLVSDEHTGTAKTHEGFR
jgi:hypothetical protein